MASLCPSNRRLPPSPKAPSWAVLRALQRIQAPPVRRYFEADIAGATYRFKTREQAERAIRRDAQARRSLEQF